MAFFSDHEVARLRKIGGMHLRELIGATVVRAVDAAFESTDLESVLAELLLLKLGSELFASRKVRNLIIESSNSESLRRLASSVPLSKGSDLKLIKEAQGYFQRFTVEKAKLFVDWLNFPDAFIPVSSVENRLDVEKVSSFYGDSVSLKGYLHPYQKDMKDQIASSLTGPGSKVMCQMPTGAGKTFTALEGLVDTLRKPFQDKFVVWLVNTNELAEQALQSFKFLWQIKGDRELNVFRLFRDFISDYSSYANGGVVFASYDLFYSILSKTHDPRRDELLYLISQTEYLVVDEAHAAVADTYIECINAFALNDITRILGLSATPTRVNSIEQEELAKLFSSRLLSLRNEKREEVRDPIRYLQEKSFLAHVDMITLESGFSSVERNETRLLKELAENSERNQLIMDSIETAADIREKTLVFACSVDHALALYILCRKRDIRSQFVIGNTPQSARQEILSSFNNGDVDVLINLDILSTGIDLPNVNRLVITRPVGSPIQYSQIVGRALRGPKNGGNAKNTIVNVLDNTFNHGTISTLYTSFQEAWSANGGVNR